MRTTQVIDSSDLLLHVLDARDPLGTRCESVEAYLAKEKRGKKVVYVLNKVDLVPGWVAVRYSPPFPDYTQTYVALFAGSMGQDLVKNSPYHRFPRFHQQLLRKGISYPASSSIFYPLLRQEANFRRIHRIPQCR